MRYSQPPSTLQPLLAGPPDATAPHRTTLCHITPHRTAPYHSALHRTTPTAAHHTSLHHTTPHRTSLHRTTPLRASPPLTHCLLEPGLRAHCRAALRSSVEHRALAVPQAGPDSACRGGRGSTSLPEFTPNPQTTLLPFKLLRPWASPPPVVCSQPQLPLSMFLI